MTSPWSLNAINELVVPLPAGNTYWTVTTTHIPAELITFYQVHYGVTPVQAMISYSDFAAGNYWYDVTLPNFGGFTFHAQGIVQSHVVFPTFHWFGSGGASQLQFGDTAVWDQFVFRNGVNTLGSTQENQVFIDSDVDVRIGNLVSGGGVAYHSMGRELCRVDCNSAVTAAIGAEAVVQTTPSNFLFRQTRVYKVVVRGFWTPSVNNNVVLRIRQGSTTAGTLLGATRQVLTAGVGALGYHFETWFVNTSGADINTTLCMTWAASAGTITGPVSTDTPRVLEVFDHGEDASYALPSMV